MSSPEVNVKSPALTDFVKFALFETPCELNSFSKQLGRRSNSYQFEM